MPSSLLTHLAAQEHLAAIRHDVERRAQRPRRERVAHRVRRARLALRGPRRGPAPRPRPA